MTDDTKSVEVADPEDYNRQQRFKEIHQARQRVTAHVADMELPRGNQYNATEAKRLAHLVSLYILELEPLFAQSRFEEGEFIPVDLPYDSLREFRRTIGVARSKKDGTSLPSPAKLLAVFSGANQCYADLGMELDLRADEGDAGFDYSDILGEEEPGTGEKPDIPSQGEKGE